MFLNIFAVAYFGCISCAESGTSTQGPVFTREPPNRVDFSNTTGAVVECSARGQPPPDIIWMRADGTAVGDVPGLRQVCTFLKPKFTFHFISIFFVVSKNFEYF